MGLNMSRNIDITSKKGEIGLSNFNVNAQSMYRESNFESALSKRNQNILDEANKSDLNVENIIGRLNSNINDN